MSEDALKDAGGHLQDPQDRKEVRPGDDFRRSAGDFCLSPVTEKGFVFWPRKDLTA